MYARKKKSFGDEESRTKLEERENVKTYRKCKKKMIKTFGESYS